MAKVRRANVVLTIKEEQVQRYVDQGYDVINENGDVIKKSVPKDIGTLTKAYHDHLAEIDKLKAEIATLKAQQKEKSVSDEEKPKRKRSE